MPFVYPSLATLHLSLPCSVSSKTDLCVLHRGVSLPAGFLLGLANWEKDKRLEGGRRVMSSVYSFPAGSVWTDPVDL